MAIDDKYGRVTVEFPGPDVDEPVVVFRAQDALILEVLKHYKELCDQAWSPQHHLERIDKSIEGIRQWQEEHPRLVRVPTSDRWAERVGKKAVQRDA